MAAILFQFERRSGVRGTMFLMDGKIKLAAVADRGDHLAAREITITRAKAQEIIDLARKHDGDGDVEILVDRWDSD